ncbi:hypothetical protein A3Q56_01626 [Intoshia linei]|uniref:Uncharacterized protein n=1 Tax=Intoshia linei TaxID=1819745 RepID=A0A177B8E5_9BILA|nr:hypothetical protein A3Q56_01626 [Intoshia linei]
MGCLYGEKTLHELRSSLQLAEINLHGGMLNHISPFTTAADFGSLLQNSGYSLITLDIEKFVINYTTIFQLIRDLKGMGESSCCYDRPSVINKNVLFSAAAIILELYKNDKHIVESTFDVLYFIAWKDDEVKPKKRGSATSSFKDLSKILDNNKL